MKTKNVITLIALIVQFKSGFAQNTEVSYVKIGDTLNYTFKNVVNYQKQKLSLSDFHGKWVVLDFWSRYCGTCIASFPKMNKLSKQFKNKAAIVMAGLYNSKIMDGISDQMYTKKLFEAKKKKYDLSFINAFESLEKANSVFDIYAVPVIIVINPEGVVMGKTLSLDSLQLATFMEGKTPSYDYAYAHTEPKPDSGFNSSLPILTNGKMSNGGAVDTSYIFRSLLCKWNPATPEGVFAGFEENADALKGEAWAYGYQIFDLLRICYTGKPFLDVIDPGYKTISQNVILEVKDSTKFISNLYNKEVNSYSYTLKVPRVKNNYLKMRKCLLSDLERTFNFSSSLETRWCEAYKIVITDKSKAWRLKTKGLKPDYRSIGVREGYQFTNWSMERIKVSFMVALYAIKTSLWQEVSPVLLDGTGMDFNIDLVVKADTYDLNSINSALNKVGLAIIKDKIPMRCIVVRDL